MVLVAVSVLAINVTTRYCSPDNASAGTVTTVHRYSLPETSRQRLTKDAITWTAPLVCAVALEPQSYSRMVPAEAPLPIRSFQNSLYNRPPPRA